MEKQNNQPQSWIPIQFKLSNEIDYKHKGHVTGADPARPFFYNVVGDDGKTYNLHLNVIQICKQEKHS